MNEVLQEDVTEEGSSHEVLTVENLNRMNDAFAKFIFAEEERKLLTLDFANSFFELEGTAQLTDFRLSDREMDPDWQHGKGVVLDVVGESSDGTLVNLEIQLRQFYAMDRRTLYYWSRLYNHRLKSGEEYEGLNRTVTINILNYKLFNDKVWPSYHSCFAVLNTKNLQHTLTKDLEIHFVELPKLTDSKKKNARHLERWLKYLSPKTTMEERRQLAMEDANIHTAMEAEKEFVKNPICITAYEQRQKYLRDEKARETFLRKQEEELCKQKEALRRQTEAVRRQTEALLKEGEALRREGEADIIKALFASGMSVEEIAMRLQKDVAWVRQILQ